MVDDVDEEGPGTHGRVDHGDLLASVPVRPSQFRVVGAQKALVQGEAGVSGLVLEHLGIDGRYDVDQRVGDPSQIVEGLVRQHRQRLAHQGMAFAQADGDIGEGEPVEIDAFEARPSDPARVGGGGEPPAPTSDASRRLGHDWVSLGK
ncbi:hypothetical protein [Streptomyces sp. NPDC005435]|uniref:hypothetical protein n=1 Tax=Streptomyces sp. NPDC005435 TaxID=3154464 RepID=UPI003456FA75